VLWSVEVDARDGLKDLGYRFLAEQHAAKGGLLSI
jgi:hypothetical protein